jgi:hypothetical protein
MPDPMDSIGFLSSVVRLAVVGVPGSKEDVPLVLLAKLLLLLLLLLFMVWAYGCTAALTDRENAWPELLAGVVLGITVSRYEPLILLRGR